MDLLPRWNATRHWLMLGKNPYADDITRGSAVLLNKQYEVHENNTTDGKFIYPIYAALFYAPIAGLEFTAAKWIWAITLLIAVGIIATIGFKNSGLKTGGLWYRIIAAMLVIGSYYSLATISAGSFTPVNAIILLLAIYCVVNQKLTGAGIFFAVATIQPQMSYLVIIYTIVWVFITRRIRLLTSFFVTQLLLIGVGYLLIPGWINGFLSQLIPLIRDTNWQGAGVMAVAGIFPGIQQRLAGILFFVLVMIMLIYWFKGRMPDEKVYLWTAFFTLSVTCVIAPLTQPGYCLLLFPSLFMINDVLHNRLGQFGFYAGITAISLLIAAGWVIYFSTQGSVSGNQVLQLIFPLFTMAGLAWARWWITRPPDRFIE